MAGKIKDEGEVLKSIHSRPTTLNCGYHPLLLDSSSTQYPDNGNAANTHTLITILGRPSSGHFFTI
jgi:hypothetical protein